MRWYFKIVRIINCLMGSGSVVLLVLFFEQLEGFGHQRLNFLVIFDKSAVPFLQVIAGRRQ